MHVWLRQEPCGTCPKMLGETDPIQTAVVSGLTRKQTFVTAYDAKIVFSAAFRHSSRSAQGRTRVPGKTCQRRCQLVINVPPFGTSISRMRHDRANALPLTSSRR